MSAPTVSPVTSGVLSVSAEAWHRWIETKNRVTALQREADAQALAMGLPDGKTLAKQLGISAMEKGEIVVTDLNGSPIGKFTVYHRDGFQMPAAWIRR